MSSDYHTPIATNAPANAAIFNIPLGQLDSAISGVFSGTSPFTKILFNAASTLTIASGSVTPTASLHLIAAESGTSDNLDTITAVNNSFLFIKADSGDTITLTDSGNLNADNIVLSDNNIILLFCQNGQWSIVNTPIHKPDKGYVVGLEISTDMTTSAVSVAAGACTDQTGTVLIDRGAVSTSINLATTGINALDTGTIANNSIYYVWAVSGASGTGCIASLSLTAPTLPAGYDLYKRRLGAFITNGSAQPYSQYMPRGQSLSRRVYYREVTNAAPYRILDDANVGTSGAQTTVDCSSIVPGTSEAVIAQIAIDRPSAAAEIYWNANDTRNRFLFNMRSTAYDMAIMFDLELASFGGAAATGRIYASAAVTDDLSFYVMGYIDRSLWLSAVG